MNIVTTKLNSIFEACSFQDVTGQLIRRAIQHLQHVENMLTEISAQHRTPATPDTRPINPDLIQADVDRVFVLVAQASAATASSDEKPALSQDDLGRLFG